VCSALAERMATGILTCNVDTREGHLGVTCSTSESCYGVLVDQVVPKDLLARAGLRAGHVILKINGKKVKDHERAAKVWTRCQKKGEKLTIEYVTEEVAKERGAAELKFELKIYGTVLALVFVFAISLFVWVYLNKPPPPPPPAPTIDEPSDGSPSDPALDSMLGGMGGMMGEMQKSIQNAMGEEKMAELKAMYEKNTKMAEEKAAALSAADEA